MAPDGRCAGAGTCPVSCSRVPLTRSRFWPSTCRIPVRTRSRSRLILFSMDHRAILLIGVGLRCTCRSRPAMPASGPCREVHPDGSPVRSTASQSTVGHCKARVPPIAPPGAAAERPPRARSATPRERCSRHRPALDRIPPQASQGRAGSVRRVTGRIDHDGAGADPRSARNGVKRWRRFGLACAKASP